MVMLEVAVTAGHPPDAAIVFVTVYVPGVLADKFTTPAAVMLIPAVEVNVPAEAPAPKVGEGLIAF